MPLQQVLLNGEAIAPGAEKRLFPGLDVSRYDRLHFHISGGSRSVAELGVRILFGTPVDGRILLADSTIWFEDTRSEREFSYAPPSTYNGTGFVMSVPVIAPQLFDVILRNGSEAERSEVFVTVMAQEI